MKKKYDELCVTQEKCKEIQFNLTKGTSQGESENVDNHRNEDTIILSEDVKDDTQNNLDDLLLNSRFSRQNMSKKTEVPHNTNTQINPQSVATRNFKDNNIKPILEFYEKNAEIFEQSKNAHLMKDNMDLKFQQHGDKMIENKITKNASFDESVNALDAKISSKLKTSNKTKKKKGSNVKKRAKKKKNEKRQQKLKRKNKKKKESCKKSMKKNKEKKKKKRKSIMKK